MKKLPASLIVALLLCNCLFGQSINSDEKAEAIIKRAVEKLGGQKYLQAKSIVSAGNFTQMIEGQMHQFSRFTDVMVFPDKERTEFKQNGVKNVQTNAGAGGWLYDGSARAIKEQSKKETEDFRRGMRTSLDYLLRGNWRTIETNAVLSYAGKRQAGIGKRNDVVKLTYSDGFAVEFEFSDDGFPAKSIYKRVSADGIELKEEDRYAQFVEVQGIFTPFVVDHFINDKHTSRINYVTIEFNKNIPDSVFAKPGSEKELKKELKF
jgi:hypothetical protein